MRATGATQAKRKRPRHDRRTTVVQGKGGAQAGTFNDHVIAIWHKEFGVLEGTVFDRRLLAPGPRLFPAALAPPSVIGSNPLMTRAERTETAF